jgi:hypothetical protein
LLFLRIMRTAVPSSFLAASLTASLLVGCGVSTSGGNGAGGPVGTQEDPVADPHAPYRLTSTVDFTIEAILPPQIEEVVVTLRQFSTNPAEALLDLAERRGVAAVGILRAALPGVLEDKLEEWINGEIAKLVIAGRPITEYAGEVAMLAEIALTQFAVDSELVVGEGGGTHRITGLDLRPAGIDFRLPIGGLAGDILTQKPDLVLGVCVGHETELRQICEGGLDAVVDFAHEKLAAMRLDVLHLAEGTARLVDDDGDGVGDRIADGVWKAELNLGLGLRHAPATFVGVR